MKKIFVTAFVLLASISGAAHAVDGTVSWVNATQDVNGTVLPTPPAPGSLKTTRVQRALVDAAATCSFTVAETVDKLQTDLSHTFLNLAVGKHCFRARHLNQEDLLSDWSGTVSKTVAPAIIRPRPPTGVAVQ